MLPVVMLSTAASQGQLMTVIPGLLVYWSACLRNTLQPSGTLEIPISVTEPHAMADGAG